MCKSPYWNKPKRKLDPKRIDELTKTIIAVHKDIIDTSGGEHGVRDKGGVYFSTYSLLNYITKHSTEPTKLGAFVYEEFAKKHHFMDGNKRTAHVVSKIIMLLHRCHFKIEYSKALPFILKIAKYNSEIKFKDINEWLDKNCEIIEEKDITTYLNNVLVDLVLEEENENN